DHERVALGDRELAVDAEDVAVIGFARDVVDRVGSPGCAPAIEAESGEEAGRAEELIETVIDDAVDVPDRSRARKVRAGRLVGGTIAVANGEPGFVVLAALNDADVGIPLPRLNLEERRGLDLHGVEDFPGAAGDAEAVERQA